MGFNEKDLKNTSRFLAGVLRHHPEKINLKVDRHGWADVEELLEKMNPHCPITMEKLEAVVENNNKQRYSFDERKKRIRANQGHSIPVDVELTEKKPPEFLFHGTADKNCESIEKKGLLHMKRLHVHLSSDVETAVNVGKRHGKPVVYRVKSGQMYKDGIKFYYSVNQVWLTEHVPKKYLERV